MKKYINPSGFPEHLPKILIQELKIRDIMRKVYESYGYLPLETSSIEYLDTLSSKGDINKEIYTISRALSEGDSSPSTNNSDSSVRALRFDLTVPFARYVAQHQNQLQFPFKRWQIQKSWRGERAQAGRFREFYQADIDVIAQNELPLHFDAEVLEIAYQILTEINFGKFTIHLNNRKLLQGILEHFNITDLDAIIPIIDKYDKIGRNKVITLLQESLKLTPETITSLLQIIEQTAEITNLTSLLDSIPDSNSNIIEGKAELTEISSLLASFLPNQTQQHGKIILNLRITRGLDYYTGTVYETTIDGLENYGSITSGGRYANLAGKFTKTELPGVGISIGLSRLMYILEKENLFTSESTGITQALIGLFNESQRPQANQLAQIFRSAGINTQVYHSSKAKIGKQISFADKIGATNFILINMSENSTDTSHPEKLTFTNKNLSTKVETILNSSDELLNLLKN